MARPRQVSDDAIISAARATFLEEGPGASVKRIAERIGVSQAALFKRFGSKTELMIAALAPTPPAALIAALGEGPRTDDLRAELLDHARALQQHLRLVIPGIWCLKNAGVPPQRVMASFDEPPMLQVRRALTGWFERGAAAGQIRAEDPSALATMLMGSLHGRAMVAKFEGAELDDATVDAWLHHVIDTLWRGIRAPES